MRPSLVTKSKTLKRCGVTTASAGSQLTPEQSSPADCASILLELFELLEEYAPMWYTEDHHNRAASALGNLLLKPNL